MSRAYLDACAIIYLLEGARPVQQLVTAKLSQCHATALITARLSRLECRVLPLKNNDTALLATYDAFFSAVGMSIGELTPDVIERATEIRDLRFQDSRRTALSVSDRRKGGCFHNWRQQARNVQGDSG